MKKLLIFLMIICSFALFSFAACDNSNVNEIVVVNTDENNGNSDANQNGDISGDNQGDTDENGSSGDQGDNQGGNQNGNESLEEEDGWCGFVPFH